MYFVSVSHTMGKKGKPGHRIKGGKKVQARKRARERRLAEAFNAALAGGGPTQEAVFALASAGCGVEGGADAVMLSDGDGSGVAEGTIAAVPSVGNTSVAADGAAVSLAMTGRWAAVGSALAVPATSRGTTEAAAAAVASTDGAAAEGDAVGVVPAGDEQAGEDAGPSPHGYLSRSLRRQRASASAAALRVRHGAASEASVEAALVPYEYAPRPLTDSVGAGCTAREINALPVVSGQVRARPGEGDVCVVCQEGIGGGDTLCELPCLHVLHPGCTRGWLTRQNRCPVCSQPVVMCVE